MSVPDWLPTIGASEEVLSHHFAQHGCLRDNDAFPYELVSKMGELIAFRRVFQRSRRLGQLHEPAVFLE